MLITALAAAITVVPYCAWTERGKDKFIGDPIAAVDNYKDIPIATREKIKSKMRVRAFDDTIHTTRDGSVSKSYRYGQISMMHFGRGNRLCGTVDTSMWAKNDPGERALIYSEDGYHVAYFSVCRNVSRLTRGERIAPPPSMAPDRAAIEVEPLTVAVDIPLPAVDSGPVAAPYEPQTFARLSSPESLSEPQQPQDAYPDRITADQSWGQMSQWRPVFGARFSRELPAPSGSVPAPVPGIFPPNDVSVPVAPVPEPKTWGLFLMGLAFVWWAVRRVRVQRGRRG